MQANLKNENKPSAREIAYLSLLKAHKKVCFIEESLKRWEASCSPSSTELSLAQEIAYGSERMKLSLHYLANLLAGLVSKKGTLRLKTKERLLLHTALYQYFYMNSIPIYALSNESVALAYHHCHPSFARFLNATLRQLPTTTLSLPKADSIKNISTHYSFPMFFVKELDKMLGLQKT